MSSIPSTIVDGLPNLRVSSRIRIRCCSFSISPQTHKSFGSPHVGQTSAMTLKRRMETLVYKSFKAFCCFSHFGCCWSVMVGFFVRFLTYTPSIYRFYCCLTLADGRSSCSEMAAPSLLYRVNGWSPVCWAFRNSP